MDLQIEYADNVPPDIKALVPVWLEDCISWLTNQPRDTTALQPRFEKLKYSVGMESWNHGLGSTKTGKGWTVLGISNNLTLDTLPTPIVVKAETELATKTRWIFLLSQSFRPESYTDKENFRHAEHLYYQLKYLDDVAGNNKTARSVLDDYEQHQQEQEEAQREAAYKAQFPLKHQQYKDRLREARYIRTPSWYWKRHPDAVVSQHEAPETAPPPKPRYSAPPPFVPAPPAEPLTHPTPELSEFQQKVIAEQQAMWDYVKQNTVTTDTLCTNPEPSTGATEDHDM